MGRLSIWILAGALLTSTPASASPSSCERDPARQQAARTDKAPPKAGEPGHGPWKFWEGDSKAELGLTNRQSAEIELIFQNILPKLEAAKQTLDKLENALSVTIKENKATTTVVAQQLDQVNAARADLYKTRTLMLYQMRAVLSADQRAKLQAMFDARHRKPSETAKR